MPTASRSEYLTIEMGATDVIIGTRACWCTNMEVLYDEEHRGTDRLVPGTAGVVANPRRLTVITHRLELVFDGNYDSDGAGQAGHQGLRDNIIEVKAATAPVSSGDGTRSVTWTRPDASTAVADCHVGPLRIGERISGSRLRATLDLNVPAGAFA